MNLRLALYLQFGSRTKYRRDQGLKPSWFCGVFDHFAFTTLSLTCEKLCLNCVEDSRKFYSYPVSVYCIIYFITINYTIIIRQREELRFFSENFQFSSSFYFSYLLLMASKCLGERWRDAMTQILLQENYALGFSREEFTSQKCGWNLLWEKDIRLSPSHVFGNFTFLPP